MIEAPVTNVIVPGRGHAMGPDGPQLSVPAIQRVTAAAAHFELNTEAFQESLEDGNGGLIVMAGGYASLATGSQMTPPPYLRREGTLMCTLGEDLGIPRRHLANSPASVSTMENILRVMEEGFFDQISPDNPLGIATQLTQWERLEWFSRKIYKLPAGAVVLIEAAGETDPKIMEDEQKLMSISKLGYGPARTPRGLRRAESTLGLVSRISTKLGLQKPPADSYLDLTD